MQAWIMQSNLTYEEAFNVFSDKTDEELENLISYIPDPRHYYLGYNVSSIVLPE